MKRKNEILKYEDKDTTVFYNQKSGKFRTVKNDLGKRISKKEMAEMNEVLKRVIVDKDKGLS